MTANLTDNQWVYLDNLTEYEDGILWEEFSVARPGTYIDRSQLASNWDGIFRKYNRAKRRIARPLLAMLRSVCSKHNLPLEIRDLRPEWKYIVRTDINEDFLPGIKLAQYQIDCLKTISQVECGIIDVPTGGGKGELIAGTCKLIECPTLILADQVIVVKQLKERLELRDVAEEVGMFYAGKRPSGQMVVVGSIQSLTAPSKPPMIPIKKHLETEAEFDKKMKKWDIRLKAFKTRKANVKQLLEYAKKAELLIVDEVDKAVSDPWKNLFRYHFSGRRRYGFSGTPFDSSKPVEAMVVQEHVGSVIFYETRKKLTDLGRIIPCDYTMLVIPGDIHEGSAFDIACKDNIVENVGFHNLIAKLCLKCKRAPNDGTLILVDREILGTNLENAISALGLRAKYIFGKTSQKKRDEMLKKFENRELDVLIGGKIINRGLDLKGGCENLIIATGGKLRSDFEQKIGRALRINQRGFSKIYDFFFRCNKYLYSHSKDRLKNMIDIGYPTKVVFPGGPVSGVDLVNSRFRVKNSLLCR